MYISPSFGTFRADDMARTTATMAILLIATAVVLIGGLAVIPALEEPAEAACEDFKKNGEPCKPQKKKFKKF